MHTRQGVVADPHSQFIDSSAAKPYPRISCQPPRHLAGIGAASFSLSTRFWVLVAGLVRWHMRQSRAVRWMWPRAILILVTLLFMALRIIYVLST